MWAGEGWPGEPSWILLSSAQLPRGFFYPAQHQHNSITSSHWICDSNSALSHWSEIHCWLHLSRAVPQFHSLSQHTHTHIYTHRDSHTPSLCVSLVTSSAHSSFISAKELFLLIVNVFQLTCHFYYGNTSAASPCRRDQMVSQKRLRSDATWSTFFWFVCFIVLI